jgi:hypothetical protein
MPKIVIRAFAQDARHLLNKKFIAYDPIASEFLQ